MEIRKGLSCYIQHLNSTIFSLIPELDSKAQNLSMMSAKYKKDAASLNAMSWVAVGAGVSILGLVFLFYKFIL